MHGARHQDSVDSVAVGVAGVVVVAAAAVAEEPCLC